MQKKFPFKIISQNYYWSDEESASIDVSPKREKREKRKKTY